jgi:hypothetical protein
VQLVWARFSNPARRALSRLTLLCSAIAVALLAITAYRGGRIRHMELLPGGLEAPAESHEE